MASFCQFAVGDGELRLVSLFQIGSGFAGRLEIFLSGEWGTVCDSGCGLSEGDTACRQLGFFSATITTSNVSSFD